MKINKKHTKRPKSKEEKKYSRILSLFFMASVAVILLVSAVVILIISGLFINSGYFTQEQLIQSKVFIIFIFISTSVVVGLAIALILGRFLLKPFKALINGMINLSKGEYSSRIHLGRYMGMAQISNSFNTMAQELENTEMLRSDFINSFSHEFKTPIASVKTLIDLLQKESLPIEKRKEYLAVIDEEISRLLDMSTNVLNLSKVENQNILTNQERYNLSEQIRKCILVLEKKWERKELSWNLEFDEFHIIANVDLMAHVWFNLLDNAIKFADEKSDLSVIINKEENTLHISIQNIGVEITEEDKNKIFHKFYQADTTHSKEGNGIGLSIVKRIVELHKGKITVNSESRKTVFTVSLPISTKL